MQITESNSDGGQAIHCPECGYRSHGDIDMGVPLTCWDCLPIRRYVRKIEHIGEPDNDE